MNKLNILINTDGGSRGNARGDENIPSAYAISVKNRVDHEIIFEYGIYELGNTNIAAEIKSLLLALHFIKSNKEHIGKVEIQNDSKNVVDSYNLWLDGWNSDGSISTRLNGEIWKEVSQLKSELKSDKVDLKVTHVRRMFNKRPDELVNKVMDTKEVLMYQKHIQLP